MRATGDRELLLEIAEQLERWQVETRRGGWSTHQTDAQAKLANRIRLHLAGGAAPSVASERTAEIVALLKQAQLVAGEVDKPGLWLAADLIDRRFR